MGRRSRRRGRESATTAAPATGFLERPQPLWGTFPLSEILIVVGFAGVVVGVARGPETGDRFLAAGIIVCALGVLEVTAREHFTGYRSHSLVLALAAPVAVLLIAGGTSAPGQAAVGLAVSLYVIAAFALQRVFPGRRGSTGAGRGPRA